MQGARRAVVLFTTSGLQHRNVPPSRPALRVATRKGLSRQAAQRLLAKRVCGVAKLANRITIRRASRLAAIVFWSQRARRIKSDRLLGYRFIAARERMEALFLHEQQKYRTLFESSSNAILVLTERGFVDCNSPALATHPRSYEIGNSALSGNSAVQG